MVFENKTKESPTARIKYLSIIVFKIYVLKLYQKLFPLSVIYKVLCTKLQEFICNSLD